MKKESLSEAIDLKRPCHRASSPVMQRRLREISQADTPEDIAEAVSATAACIGFPLAQLMVINTLPRPKAFSMKQASAKMLRFDHAIIVGSDLAGVHGLDGGSTSCPRPGPWPEPHRVPLLRQMPKCPLPVVWGTDTHVGHGGDAGAWGLPNDGGNGISMHFPLAIDDARRLFFVGVSVRRHERIRAAEQARLSADVALMTMHAAAGSERVLVPLLLAAAKDASPLTPAMRQYLAWAERGKTAGETAEIVGRKYSTVKNVLAQAIERMGCSGKADAVRMARANGWL